MKEGWEINTVHVLYGAQRRVDHVAWEVLILGVEGAYPC